MIGFGGHEAKRRASGAAGRVGTSRRDERPCRVRQMGRDHDGVRDLYNHQENCARLAPPSAVYPGAVKHGWQVRACHPTPIIGRQGRPFKPGHRREGTRACSKFMIAW